MMDSYLMVSGAESSLKASFSGAIQASLSVILILSYGLIAARFNLMNETSAASVSRLCVNMFLPALVITNVGSQLDSSSINKYVPVFLWSIVYTFLSMAYGKAVEKWFGLPTWTSAACSFNNTTSLPLLLVQSLQETGFLESIAGGDSDGAVERAKSFFLINSMISNGLTFAFGPKLLNEGSDEEEEDSESSSDSEEDNLEDGQQQPDEETSLIPTRIRKPVSKGYTRTRTRLHSLFLRLPHPIQVTLTFISSLVNAPLLGAFVAVIVGLTPPLHTALFDDPNKGGIFKAWLTSSVKNIGELFTSLQMFIVGTKLSASWDADQRAKNKKDNRHNSEDGDEEEVGELPKTALAVIFTARFVLWPLASISTIYFLARKNLLSSDPIVWFSMMLMPTGPPAIILSSLAELSGSRKDKMSVAKLLTVSYAVTPVICFTVVGALKACEVVMEKGK